MDALPNENQTDPAPQSTQTIQLAQEKIYSFFLEIVRRWEPETVLQEFKQLFITPVPLVDLEILHAVYEIIFFKNEEEFRNTLKRTCYILINHWWIARQYSYIPKLIQLFAENKSSGEPILSLALTHLNNWIQNFVNSQDYQDLKLFSSLFEEPEKSYWSHRYATYLLASQSIDLNNPIEQREAARELSKHLRDKFKRDLAMYAAHSHSASSQDTLSKNPTQLGDEALHLIKRIVAKRGLFSYVNLANIFIKQNQQVSYKLFKQNLNKYIFDSLYVETKAFLKTLKEEFLKKISSLYGKFLYETLNNQLILRSCNQMIEYLTIENKQQPSSIFVLLVAQGETLALAIILLKIILISPNSRAHLESRIANLIRYYENYPEKDCWGAIHFLEVLNIVFTVYTEDVEYNLLKVKAEEADNQAINDLDAYRIFTQQRRV